MSRVLASDVVHVREVSSTPDEVVSKGRLFHLPQSDELLPNHVSRFVPPKSQGGGSARPDSRMKEPCPVPVRTARSLGLAQATPRADALVPRFVRPYGTPQRSYRAPRRSHASVEMLEMPYYVVPRALQELG